MLNHAGSTYLPVFNDQVHGSVLGRVAARKMRELQQRPGASGEDDAKPSPATGDHVRKFLDAWGTGDDAAQSDALNKIVQTWRADNAAGGVPVHGHLPLPAGFAATLARLLRDSGTAETALEKVLADVEPSSRPLLELQVRGLARQDETPHGNPHNGPERAFNPESVGRARDRGGVTFEDHRQVDSLGQPVGSSTPILNSSAGGASNLMSDDAVARARTIPLALRREAGDAREDESDPIYDVAHPFAYGLDQALNDFFGKDGALGDWGKREVIPTPKDDLSRNAGELIRHYLQIGVPLGGVVKGAKLAGAIRLALEKRSTKAIIGGSLSVIAEWRTNGDKATGWDYGLSFVTGAITGGYEPKWGKAELDGALAFSSAVLGDILSGRDVDVGMALVGGATAWFVTRAGGLVKFKESRLLSQLAGKYAKKYLEKEAKEFFKVMFGDELVLTGKEWNRFLDALADHMRRQYEEFIQQGDIDPIF